MILPSTSRVRAAACIAALLLPLQANSADLSWTKPGAYEACLKEEAETWLNARAEDVVNGAESVKSLDDGKVVAWAVQTMKNCSSKGAAGDPGNDTEFVKYMAHWRAHLYELARVIRAKGGSD